VGGLEVEDPCEHRVLVFQHPQQRVAESGVLLPLEPDAEVRARPLGEARHGLDLLLQPRQLQPGRLVAATRQAPPQHVCGILVAALLAEGSGESEVQGRLVGKADNPRRAARSASGQAPAAW
jgi:hypothetical protein